MIVAITGTGYAFPRLVEALARFQRTHPDEQVWVQHGKTPLADGLLGAPLVPRDELMGRLRGADVVVSHGGSGSIADALRAGHVPVVIPRLQRLGEHVNDHQLEIVDALASDGRIIPVHDVFELTVAIGQAREASHQQGERELGVELKCSVAREIAARARPASRRAALVWRALTLTQLLPQKRVRTT